jgi:phage gpG-like protein
MEPKIVVDRWFDVNTDLSPVFKDVSERMRNSVLANFTAGGRPTPWKTSPNFLLQSYRLRGSVKESSGSNFAEVEAGRGLPYAFIHQFGGTTKPTITEASRGFFWKKFFETKDEKWKWMALSKKSKFTVKIPARPYMLFQESDIEYIGKALMGGIVKFYDAKTLAAPQKQAREFEERKEFFDKFF